MKTTETAAAKTEINTFEQFKVLAGKNHQITAQEVINGRSYINGQWQEVNFSDSFKDAFILSIITLLGGWERTKFDIANTLRYSKPQHWGLGRIFLEQYGESPARWNYCAGQDYPAELQTIRKALK